MTAANEFGTVFEEDVLAVTVVPKGNTGYARERDWIEPDESFDLGTIVSKLHRQVTDLCPTADYRHKVVDRSASTRTIAKRVRWVAKSEDASMVFLGSDNAGTLVRSISSVGQTIATDDAYDVVIVRNRSPARVAKLREASPHHERKSDFYLP